MGHSLVGSCPEITSTFLQTLPAARFPKSWNHLCFCGQRVAGSGRRHFPSLNKMMKLFRGESIDSPLVFDRRCGKSPFFTGWRELFSGLGIYRANSHRASDSSIRLRLNYEYQLRCRLNDQRCYFYLCNEGYFVLGRYPVRACFWLSCIPHHERRQFSESRLICGR